MTNILSIPTDPLFDILVQVDDPLAITATCKDLRDYSDLLAQKLLHDIRTQTRPEDLCRILPILDSELSAPEKVKLVFQNVVNTHRSCWQWKSRKDIEENSFKNDLKLTHEGLPTVSLRRWNKMMYDIQVKADGEIDAFMSTNFRNVRNGLVTCKDINFLPSDFSRSFPVHNVQVIGILGRNKITYIPTDFCKLTLLTEFHLNLSFLSDLPDEFSQLTNLTDLDLSENKFKTLPSPIIHLTNLNTLTLNNNHISQIPDEITRLKQLTLLDLRENKISNIPWEVNPPYLKLTLTGNPITNPPQDFREWAAQKYYEEFPPQPE